MSAANWPVRVPVKVMTTKLSPTEKVQLNQSDVISFHSYDNLDGVKRWVANLRKHGRPLICTEYLARGNGSNFDTILPLLKKERVAAYNWGLVMGKTQTHLPWDSWKKPYVDREPEVHVRGIDEDGLALVVGHLEAECLGLLDHRRTSSLSTAARSRLPKRVPDSTACSASARATQTTAMNSR